MMMTYSHRNKYKTPRIALIKKRKISRGIRTSIADSTETNYPPSKRESWLKLLRSKKIRLL